MQIAEIGRPDQHTMAHLAVRRLQIGHRLAMIGHGDRDAAVGAGAELAGARHCQALDLDLISRRRERLGAILAADREVGGKGDLPTERLRLKMDDHVPWAWRQVENPHQDVPSPCCGMMCWYPVRSRRNAIKMHVLAGVLIELRNHLTARRSHGELDQQHPCQASGWAPRHAAHIPPRCSLVGPSRSCASAPAPAAPATGCPAK